MQNPFTGRKLSVVNDFSVDEQFYLYEQTRELKTAVASGKGSDRFRLSNRDLSLYLMFLEDSTRTKESFRNAAKFHGCRVNEFLSGSSSFNKKESLTDTVKMLFGYAERSLFIIRSKREGVCTWLDSALSRYAESIGKPAPVFINAGDGKHEHPTQELLDEFTFLEQSNWDRSQIHIALVGDLFHGRTVHSKVDGLNVFHQVQVDLIAPEELQMPEHYIQKMHANGYTVNIYPSIDEYLAAGNIAPIWYFTRLQLERMGDKILNKAASLRRSVTFRAEWIDKVQDKACFYHPLPRHREFPVIPTFLDHTALNGWDRQSMNGYYTRIVEIALLMGHLGNDFKGAPRITSSFPDDFIEEVAVSTRAKPDYKVGIRPVTDGIVIDHICRGESEKEIWNHIDKVRKIMHFDCVSSHGVYWGYKKDYLKGIISLPDIIEFDQTQLKMLGAIVPGCTVNVIKNGSIEHKYKMHMPHRVYNFKEISCKNENCISHPAYHEPVKAEFIRSEKNTFTCLYCEKPHTYQEIWDF